MKALSDLRIVACLALVAGCSDGGEGRPHADPAAEQVVTQVESIYEENNLDEVELTVDGVVSALGPGSATASTLVVPVDAECVASQMVGVRTGSAGARISLPGDLLPSSAEVAVPERSALLDGDVRALSFELAPGTIGTLTGGTVALEVALDQFTVTWTGSELCTFEDGRGTAEEVCGPAPVVSLHATGTIRTERSNCAFGRPGPALATGGDLCIYLVDEAECDEVWDCAVGPEANDCP